MELTYNMSIIIQVMYPKDLRKHAEKNKHISTLIVTTALFTLANKQKKSKCPWTDNSINKMWYTHSGI